MREIKFRAWDGDKTKGYKMHGYWMRQAKYHPYCNKRGYVPEHRLVFENYLQRYLIPRKEIIHHINGKRDDNHINNLELKNPKDHANGHIGSRNPNGQFVCKSPEFKQKKFRLYDHDRNIIKIFDLNELISKTYRRGCFEYRGEWTGLKDKNGKEIYEGDLVYDPDLTEKEFVDVKDESDPEDYKGFWCTDYYINEVFYNKYKASFELYYCHEFTITDKEDSWAEGDFLEEAKKSKFFSGYNNGCTDIYETDCYEVIGNIYENKDVKTLKHILLNKEASNAKKA